LRKLDGPTSTYPRPLDIFHFPPGYNRSLTCRTLIELLEYVLRNATLPGPSPELFTVTLDPEDVPITLAVGRNRSLSLDDVDDIVSNESVPFSIECVFGKGGTISDGAKSPFLVVVDPPAAVPPVADRELSANSPLALGAEATRRINRVADAPTDLGLSGPGREWAVDGSPATVFGFLWSPLGIRESALRCFSCFSDLVRGLGDLESASVERCERRKPAMGELKCDVDEGRGVPLCESVDCVLDEL